MSALDDQILKSAIAALLKRYMRQRRVLDANIPIEEHVVTFSQEELLETHGLFLIMGKGSDGSVRISLAREEEIPE